MNLSARRRLINQLIIISFLNLMGCDVHAQDRAYIYKLPFIEDVSIKTEFKERVRGSRDIRLGLAYQRGREESGNHLYRSHPPNFIRSVVEKSSKRMDSYLLSRGVTTRDCRGYKYNLNIILIEKDVLQSNRRFESFFLAKYGQSRLPGGHVMYAFYNSTPEIDNESTILLTNISRDMNERVFAHEMAHYLWDRLCLANNFSETSEQFAVKFENYYMRMNNE